MGGGQESRKGSRCGRPTFFLVGRTPIMDLCPSTVAHLQTLRAIAAVPLVAALEALAGSPGVDGAQRCNEAR